MREGDDDSTTVGSKSKRERSGSTRTRLRRSAATFTILRAPISAMTQTTKTAKTHDLQTAEAAPGIHRRDSYTPPVSIAQSPVSDDPMSLRRLHPHNFK